MSLPRLPLALALSLVLSLDASAAGGDKAKKKNKKPVKGVVTAVTRDKDGGTITVKVGAGKKNAATASAMEKKFTITKDTKFEKVAGKKAGGEAKPATFADLRAKSKVRVTVKDEGAAKLVQFQDKGKKKAKG
jgi:hypothetical protein